MDYSRKRLRSSAVGSYRGTPVRVYGPPRRPGTVTIAAIKRYGRGRRKSTAGLFSGRSSRNLEIKSVDFPVNASTATCTLNSTMYIQALNVCQAGSAFYNRIGNEIEMKSLHLVGQVIANGAASTGVNEYLRIMLIYDRQPNGAYPVLADILSNYDNNGTTSSSSYAMTNPNNKDRFQILMDDRLSISNNITTVATQQNTAYVIDYIKNEVNISRYVKLKGLMTRFKTSTSPSVIGDISTGALYLVGIGNQAAGANGAGYQFLFNSRLKYTD